MIQSLTEQRDQLSEVLASVKAKEDAAREIRDYTLAMEQRTEYDKLDKKHSRIENQLNSVQRQEAKVVQLKEDVEDIWRRFRQSEKDASESGHYKDAEEEMGHQMQASQLIVMASLLALEGVPSLGGDWKSEEIALDETKEEELLETYSNWNGFVLEFGAKSEQATDAFGVWFHVTALACKISPSCWWSDSDSP